ncbi:hypothetical protein HDU77_003119 [Chytriomyces hyalinus]|nr:hypothetical protein HDU77_003119 [Chytriomyces hyalinus]
MFNLLAHRTSSALLRPLSALGNGAFASLQQTRSIVYKKESNAKLPGYILPKQKSKTSFYTKMLKDAGCTTADSFTLSKTDVTLLFQMKFLRLRFGKTGQRARQPRYGRDDAILSKMNF